MILDAVEKGLITPGKMVLVDITGGNTGEAIAMVARHRGYRVIIIMPDSCSMERCILVRSLGVDLILAGAELWEATAGKVDIFVAGCGTGGTVTGAGQYLKSKKPSIQVGTV
ncbi:unnamed protein product [Sphagnum balticum]